MKLRLFFILSMKYHYLIKFSNDNNKIKQYLYLSFKSGLPILKLEL